MAELGETLSDREIDVLRCVAEGLTNKEAAETLHISPYTVKTHLRNIYTKLGANSRTEATLVGMERGLIVIPGQDNAVAVVEPITRLHDTLAPIQTDGTSALQKESPAPSERTSWMILAGLGLLLIALAVGGVFWFNGRSTPAPELIIEERALGNNWSVIEPFDTPRSHMALATVGQFIYQIGGEGDSGTTDDVLVVDTHQGTVERRSEKPTAVSYATAAVLYGEIYVAGGRTDSGEPTRAVEVYSPFNDGWLSITSLLQPLYGTLTLADEAAGTLYVFGGYDGESAVATAYKYDLDQDSWLRLPDMPEPRFNASGGLVNDTVYIVGGEFDGKPLKSCMQFSLETETWSSCAEMQMVRSEAAAVSFISKLYVFGGQIATGDEQLIAEVYDPSTDTWTPILGPTELNAVQNWTGLGVGLVETRIYVTSGLLDDQSSTMAYIYSPLSNRVFLPTSATGE